MKQCTMNCGPAAGDKRSNEQRRAECTDCIDVAEPDKYLDRDEYIRTLRTMQSFGGGFAWNLANAGFVADNPNCKRLQDAFPELFSKYGPGTDFYKAVI